MTDQIETLEDASAIVAQFESLGGSGHGCEFGIFQRHHGIEPLGLLRWADLGHEALTAALNSRIEGVGLTDHTEIFIPDRRRNDEWWSCDKRYWMAMRTFMSEAAVPFEKAQELILKRLQFLRDKLIADLQADEKIFVYKNMFRNLTYNELAALYLAIRSYGDNTLLYIRYADENHPNGSVMRLAPGLLIGAVDHFSYSPTDEPLDVPNESFLAICRSALQLWRDPAIAGSKAELGGFQIALADQLSRLNRVEEAIAAVRGAVALAPDNPHWQNRLAHLLLRAERPADAEGAARAAVANAPEAGDFHETLAICLERQGRSNEWAAAAQRAAELKPDYAPRQMRLARSLFDAGRFDEAEAAVRQAIELDPQAVGQYDLLSWISEKKNRWDEVANAMQRALEVVPGDTGRQHRLALALMRTDDHAAAEQVLREAGPPTSRTAAFHHHHLLGIVLQSQGRLDEAINEARQACEAEPNNLDIHTRLATMLLSANRVGEAELVARAAIERWPDSPTLHEALVTSMQRQGGAEDAFADSQRVDDLALHDAQQQASVANTLIDDRRFGEAEVVVRGALAQHPDAVILYEMLGQALALQHRNGEAVAVLRTGAELPGAPVSLYIMLGHRLFEMGDLAEAERIFERAIEIDPDSDEARTEIDAVRQRRSHVEAVPDSEENGGAATAETALLISSASEVQPNDVHEPEQASGTAGRGVGAAFGRLLARARRTTGKQPPPYR